MRTGRKGSPEILPQREREHGASRSTAPFIPCVCVSIEKAFELVMSVLCVKRFLSFLWGLPGTENMVSGGAEHILVRESSVTWRVLDGGASGTGDEPRFPEPAVLGLRPLWVPSGCHHPQ